MIKHEFKPGQIIEKFETNGKKVVFRALEMSDLKESREHINKLIAEKAYIAMQKKVSMKREKEWIKNELSRIKKGEELTIVALVDNKFSGLAKVWKHPTDANKHVSEIAIGFSANRGIGLGTRMMQALEEAAKNYFKSEVLIIKCFEDNAVAQSLYKKMGFIERGRIPKAVNHYGKYMNELILSKELK